MAPIDEHDRRHFLTCMAWVGTGAMWTMASGILKGSPLGAAAHSATASDAPCSRGERPVSIEASALLVKLDVERWASKTVPRSAASSGKTSGPL